MGRKLTHEEFITKVKDKNEYVRQGNIEVRGKYVGISEKIECHCNIHDTTWYPIAGSLYKGIGCKECAKDLISIKNSMSHEEFEQGLREKNGLVNVITPYRGMNENVTLKFMCGHTWTTKAANAYYRIIKCPYCSGQRVLAGFNDLWTTSALTAKILTDPKDGYKFSKGSGEKVSFTCPVCGKTQLKIIKNVVTRGLQCSYCGDGISYPNKFGRAFLDQLPIDDYFVEWQPEWAKPYFYDNYFEYNNTKYILEMDGGFHYNDNDDFGPSLEERQEIDYLKNQLAQNHGVTVIRIDSRESDCNYIKANILKSILSDIFELDLVNWQQCDIKAQKSLIKIACELYMNETKSITELSQRLKVGRNAIARYLKIGANFNWCDYEPKKLKLNSTIQNKINERRRY